MKKADRITKLCESLAQDVGDIRVGKLDTKTSGAICRHVNAIVKAENINLQYDRICERIDRQNKEILKP